MTKKSQLVLLLTLFLVLVAAACGGKEEVRTGEQPGSNQTTGSGQTGSPAEEKPATIKAEGTFSGLVDNHTVEIILKDGPTAFQHEAGLQKALSEITTNDKVRIEYFEKKIEQGEQKATQLWLTSIEKSK
ncbi:hypothetical protein [Paenibacillus turpanensis]|uniref:hypothetical protein n=1 Tax=Paenibacillus turpanensis TaxID=2689078 RepID=UPI00140D542E|nr:hypothetical protein [Paenibacillus turpanensis]